MAAIDSEILNCRMSAESFKQFSLPSTYIHYVTFFRYVIPEFVQENRVLYLDYDMILTQDLLPLFEVDLNGFGNKSCCSCPSKRVKFFIEDAENGYLVPYSETMDEDLLVSQMADKILFALESDLESMYQASYDLIKHYLKPEMLEAWRKLLMPIR
ncbi:glycosyltransferase [Streptococcus thermophilus]|uniref:glycosyltransferase n=1 Tax=Streptococcus thermophilus TaxID=1308 RepID=UPI001E33618F|nr:glycosyltransferase [Streptococcus thermophilus]